MKNKKIISTFIIATMFSSIVSSTSLAQVPDTTAQNPESTVTSSESKEVEVSDYVVNYSAENGTISTSIASGAKVANGTKVTFTAKANEGYTFDYWLVKNEKDEILERTTDIKLTQEITENENVQAVFIKGTIDNLTVDFVRKEIENLNLTWEYGKTMDQAYGDINIKLNELKQKLKLDTEKIAISAVEVNGSGFIIIQITSPVEDKKAQLTIFSSEVLKIQKAIKEIDALNLVWDKDMRTTLENYKKNDELQTLIKRLKEEGLMVELVSDDMVLYYSLSNNSAYVKTGSHITQQICSPEYIIFKEACSEFESMNFMWTSDLSEKELKAKIKKDTKELISNANIKLHKINSNCRIENFFNENYYNDEPNTRIVTILDAGLTIVASKKVRRSNSISFSNPKANELIETYESQH